MPKGQHRLVLRGHVPSKKNLLRVANGHGYRDTKVVAEIEALRTYARIAWGLRRPLEHPKIEVRFFVKERRGDRDNMLTTILDCLTSAGVLVNDNIARCNGTITIRPAVVTADEPRCEILLEEQDEKDYH